MPSSSMRVAVGVAAAVAAAVGLQTSSASGQESGCASTPDVAPPAAALQGEPGDEHAQLPYGVPCTPTRRQTFWLRSEFNQREESPAFGGGVSSPWFFETLGFEQIVAGGARSGLQLGLFGEATYIDIPPSLRAFYGTESAATVNVGLHLFGMWMLDASFRPMRMGIRSRSPSSF